jgi:hypothetical protein
MNVDEVLQNSIFANELNARLLAGSTVSSVCPHEELGLNLLTPSCLTVGEHDRYVVSILPDIGMSAFNQAAKFTCQDLPAQQSHKIVLMEMHFLGRTVFLNRPIGEMVDHPEQ